MDDFTRITLAIEMAHQSLHTMPEPDAESDICLVALTERDLLMIGLALPVMQLAFPCLGDVSEEFQHRLMDLVRVQRPDWIKNGETEGTDDE